jgi:hypothetical protein
MMHEFSGIELVEFTTTWLAVKAHLMKTERCPAPSVASL